MPFKFDSHKFYLTFAQCGDLDWQSIADVIRSKADIKWARFGHERHEDGGWHWHVCGEWTKRVQSRSERFLDVAGFHPNIQSTRCTSAVVDYVSKHGEFFDIGDVPQKRSRSTISEALALAGDPDELKYLTACAEARLAGYVIKRARELAFATACPFTIYDSYERPAGVQLQRGLEYAAMPTNTAAVLVGPAGIGKTVWAKWVCPKPAILISCKESLKAYRPNYHRTIIFDDMNFAEMLPSNQIHLLDWWDSRAIRVLYGTITIPAKTSKIFTSNCWPFLDVVKCHQMKKPEWIPCVDAILRRITKIELV